MYILSAADTLLILNGFCVTKAASDLILPLVLLPMVMRPAVKPSSIEHEVKNTWGKFAP